MAAYNDEVPYYQQSSQHHSNMSPPITPVTPATPIPPPGPSRPSSSGLFADAVKEGWVLKKGPQSLHGWKKRYLQLSRDKHLAYYTDESMVKRKGTIFLKSLTVHHIKRSLKVSDSKHHGFSIQTSGRTYQFCVSSATSRDHWIQKIREVVDEQWNAHKPSISYTQSQTPSINATPKYEMNGGKAKKEKHGFNDNAYGDWDDDEDDNTSKGVTLAIKKNMLKDKEDKAKKDAFNFEAKDETKEDRFAHRSKYKRRNKEDETVLTQQEAQEQIQMMEKKNDDILDEALMTSYETQEIAADTAQKLDDQRHQLINIDKNLHEIDEDLDKTEGILDGMKSWGGMIKRKFKKDKEERTDYTAPIDNNSTFERNGDRMDVQIAQYEADNKQNDKLDELLNNMKALNQTAHDINNELDEQNVIIEAIDDKMDKVKPRLQQQTNTMEKIV